VWFASAALLYSAALVILRGRPTIRNDAGIFLSVGGLLTHGARLYAGVWDNKPPLFYYDYAITILAGGWRGPFVLDIVWIWVACVSMGLLLRALGASRLTVAVGVIVYPVLLTGAWYYAGYSELPTLALLTVTAWLWMRGSPLGAGLVLGLMIFFHPEYCVVALAVMAAPVVTGTLRGHALGPRVVRLLVGAGGSVAVIVAIMAARGELSGYVSTMWGDVGYPDRKLAVLDLPTGVAGHVTLLRRLVDSDAARRACLILVLVWGAAWYLVWRRRHGTGAPADAPGAASTLVACWVLATLSSVGVLIFTTLFDHDLQLMALPGALTICVIAAWIEQAGLPQRAMLPAVVLTIALGAVAFGGVVAGSLASGGSVESPQPLSEWVHTPPSITAELLNRGASISGKHGGVTYARLGSNDDDAHGVFIDGDLHLACPVFDQYPFSANLNQTLHCLMTTRPDLVVVGAGFAPLSRRTPQPNYDANWNAFVDQSLAVLHENYVVVSTAPDVGGDVVLWCSRQVCRAPTSPGPGPS
jgi:hypothetical protein